MAYFQIVDADLMQQVEAQLAERDALQERIEKFAKLIGVKSYNMENSLFSGLYLVAVGVQRCDEKDVDLTKWRKVKTLDPDYLQLVPRKSNKQFAKLYEDNFPKEQFSYWPMLKMILKNNDYCPFTKGGIGLFYAPGKYVILDTTAPYEFAPGIKEITESEYFSIRAEVSKEPANV